MRSYFGYEKPMHFIFPVDGTCVNEYDGEVVDGKLFIKVKLNAPAGREIFVNEKKAEYNSCGNYYECEIGFKAYRTTLFAEDKTHPENNMKIVVYKLSDCTGKYRLSVDDNIIFLIELAKNKDVYNSIFDHQFLAIYKKAHDLYGTKTHINIYYEYTSECMKHFSEHKEYFNITMMPDKFKPEFIANSDWLKFSFHARSNDPDKPYIDTTYERMDADIKLIHDEMKRFMGEEVFTPVTTLHWGESTIAGVRALRENGYKAIDAYFDFDEKTGEPLVSLYYPPEVIKSFCDRDFWVDTEEDVICAKVDAVLNTLKLEQVVPELERIKLNPHKAGFLELLIHEQYFYSDYRAYIPEYAEIILTACEWAAKNGYKPALFSEVIFEPTNPYNIY